MSSRLLSLYSLKFNPFRADVPVEALHVTPPVHTFLRRVETGVVDGGFALVSGDPGTGKSVVLRLVREHLGALSDVTVGTIEYPQSRVPDFRRGRQVFGSLSGPLWFRLRRVGVPSAVPRGRPRLRVRRGAGARGPRVDRHNGRLDPSQSSPALQGQIRRWLHRLMIPGQEREDVAQEVTLQALRSARTFDPTRASLERWINRIAGNVAADWHERARHRREDLPGELEEQEDDAAPADVAIGAELERLLVLEALQLVPLNLRAIVVAHEIYEIPMTEIAERSGVPVSTTSKRREGGLAALADALRKLRR